MEFRVKQARLDLRHGPFVHELAAYTGAGDRIGYLRWDPKTGEIAMVRVLPAWRRQGVAATLLLRSRAVATALDLAQPAHSNAKTQAGSAWVDAMAARGPSYA
jgi:GNAT superfamily N-acetyltransferase